MDLTKKSIEDVQNFWTTDIKIFGLMKLSIKGKHFYVIHDLRTGFHIHMEDEELYEYTVNKMLEKGSIVFNNLDELPVRMTVEEHIVYIKQLQK